jgi:hypothetical protein
MSYNDSSFALMPCRCRDVMWALNRFGVRLVDSVMARAALVADEGEATPEWVLHVGAVTDAQVGRNVIACNLNCTCCCAQTSHLLHVGAVSDAQVSWNVTACMLLCNASRVFAVHALCGM